MSGTTSPQEIAWRKLCASGECIEIAQPEDGRIAFRIGGIVSTCTQVEFSAFAREIKEGAADDLLES